MLKNKYNRRIKKLHKQIHLALGKCCVCTTHKITCAQHKKKWFIWVTSDILRICGPAYWYWLNTAVVSDVR